MVSYFKKIQILNVKVDLVTSTLKEKSITRPFILVEHFVLLLWKSSNKPIKQTQFNIIPNGFFMNILKCRFNRMYNSVLIVCMLFHLSQKQPYSMEVCLCHIWQGEIQIFFYKKWTYDWCETLLQPINENLCHVSDVENIKMQLNVSRSWNYNYSSSAIFEITLLHYALFCRFWDACFMDTSSWCVFAYQSSDRRQTSPSVKGQWFWLCSTPSYQVTSVFVKLNVCTN